MRHWQLLHLRTFGCHLQAPQQHREIGIGLDQKENKKLK
jgi:hypothetical protein